MKYIHVFFKSYDTKGKIDEFGYSYMMMMPNIPDKNYDDKTLNNNFYRFINIKTCNKNIAGKHIYFASSSSSLDNSSGSS